MLERSWSCGAACDHLFLLVPERGNYCGSEWMERSGLNGAQPWDLELLCGRERRRREEGGMERKKSEEGGASRRRIGRGRAGVSEKQGVRDRWTKGEGREGGGSGTTDVLSLGQLAAFSLAIVEV